MGAVVPIALRILFVAHSELLTPLLRVGTGPSQVSCSAGGA